MAMSKLLKDAKTNTTYKELDLQSSPSRPVYRTLANCQFLSGIPFLPEQSDLCIFLGLEHVNIGACNKSTIATVGYTLQCA